MLHEMHVILKSIDLCAFPLWFKMTHSNSSERKQLKFSRRDNIFDPLMNKNCPI
jgi:hypothetical protein